MCPAVAAVMLFVKKKPEHLQPCYINHVKSKLRPEMFQLRDKKVSASGGRAVVKLAPNWLHTGRESQRQMLLS